MRRKMCRKESTLFISKVFMYDIPITRSSFFHLNVTFREPARDILHGGFLFPRRRRLHFAETPRERARSAKRLADKTVNAIRIIRANDARDKLSITIAGARSLLRSRRPRRRKFPDVCADRNSNESCRARERAIEAGEVASLCIYT